MRAKYIYESILKPKSEEEIFKAYMDLYGFIPSNKTKVISIPDEHYPIEYHESPDGRFWKRTPRVVGPLLTKVQNVSYAEENWVHDVMNGDIKLTDPAKIYKENYH